MSAQYPVLKTGAVAQYPLQSTTRFNTTVLRYLDGSEQRFRAGGNALMAWEIWVQKLDEKELSDINAFHAALRGSAQTFTFADPWTGLSYSNCRITDECWSTGMDVASSSTAIHIIQEQD
jgi:phage-related protein